MSCLVDVIRPTQKSLAIGFDAGCILVGSFFIALLAQISIPLGFTPVPFTLQTLAVLLVGALLGPKKGVLAVLAYLFEGGIGLPFFAGASSGLAALFGPTGGYFLGFILAAFITGFLLEKGWKQHFSLTLCTFSIAHLSINLLGTLWLSLYVGMDRSLALGMYPFLMGDIVKVLFATAIIASSKKILQKS